MGGGTLKSAVCSFSWDHLGPVVCPAAAVFPHYPSWASMRTPPPPRPNQGHQEGNPRLPVLLSSPVPGGFPAPVYTCANSSTTTQPSLDDMVAPGP